MCIIIGVLSDEERYERKRMSAILYQKYKNRASVINPGSKEVPKVLLLFSLMTNVVKKYIFNSPKGKPNCLAGLTFLVTGVLESLERDEAASIIKDLGGKMMTTVGKRLNYLIVGEEAGPKKLAQAGEFGVNVLSEDGLLDLIRQKSGDLSKQVAKEEKQTNREIEKAKLKLFKEKKEVKKEKHTDQHIEKAQHENPMKEKKSDEKLKIPSPKKGIKVEKSPNMGKKGAVKREKIETDATNSEVNKGDVETKKEIDDRMLPWVDKYKPTSVKEIVGQFGPSSNVSK